MIRRGLTLIASLLIIAAVAVAASSPPELFQKGKEEFKNEDYKSSLATFEELDRVSQQPELAAERQKLAPAIAFYRGANLAALGRKAEAIEQFESYIGAMPNAALDEKLYPKEVIAAFNQARENARKSGGDLAAVYARFHPAPGATVASDEKWASTPVRYIMTAEEKTRWAELSTNEDRAVFVAEFWAKRDPSPGTPENEFRSEFERRVLFSDAAFLTNELRGSETDSAVVFTFFGAPTYVRTTELQGEEMDALRGRAQGQNLPSRQGLDGSRTRSRPEAAGTRSLEGAARRGRRETWHYNKNRLPNIVAFQEVEFAFTTRKGYGERVLDRESRGLLALETVAENTGKTLKLN